MFANDNRNRLETYEDHEAHPAGKALLQMPWLWETNEYPKKTEPPPIEKPPQTTLPEQTVRSAAYKPVPDPFTPAKTPEASGFNPGSADTDRANLDFIKNLQKAYNQQRAFTDQLAEKINQNPLRLSFASQDEKPAPNILPAATPEAAPAPFKKTEPPPQPISL